MMLGSRWWLIAAAVCVSLAAMAPSAYGASLSVNGATVNQPGDPAQVCVTLSNSGGEIAGTQNDLVWDGTCATLAASSDCAAIGGHGKPLAADFPRNAGDFTIRAIILSFNNVDPLPDGPLYCCKMTVEASPGQCCPISVQMALGSTPDGGKSISLAGNQAQLCTRDDQSGRGGGVGGGPSMNQPLSASNAPANSGANVPQPAANQPALANGPPGGAPVSQVLPGGGAAPGQIPGAAPQPGNAGESGLPAEAAPTIAMTGPRMTPAVAAPTVPRPALAPPTAAGPPSTAAATLPAAAPTVAAAAPAVRTSVIDGTPTHRAALPTTHLPIPTRRAGANAQQVAPVEAEKSGGWFGCQIAAGASAVPVLGLGALGALVVVLRRRRAGRR